MSQKTISTQWHCKKQEWENATDREVRSGKRREFVEGGKTKVMSETLARDAARVWSRAPENIKEAKTLINAKKDDQGIL